MQTLTGKDFLHEDLTVPGTGKRYLVYATKKNIEIFNSYENWFINGTSKSLITSTKYTLSTASQMEQLFRVSMPYYPINDKKRTTLSDRTWKQIPSLPPVQSWWILKWLASLLWVTTVQTQKSKFVSFTSRKPFTEKYSSLVVLFSYMSFSCFCVCPALTCWSLV